MHYPRKGAMVTTLNRSEIVFLYDVKDANPNGDPYENKPRIDDETGLNIVTDTRLKRTIRDYLHNFKNKDVFITIKRDEQGNLKTREDRLKELEINKSNQEKFIKAHIDIRLFGATIGLKSESGENGKKSKGWSITRIGPVQFNLGRSLNRVKVETIKGTTVMPSDEQKAQGTFTETSMVHYSLICFHGIINEHAAQETFLTEEDVNLLLEALWNGTKNLITRSKFGQEPRMLLQVIYKENEYHIGDLHKMLSPKFSKDESSIRDVNEVSIDASQLVGTLKENAAKIGTVQIGINSRLTVNPDIKKTLEESGIDVKELKFD
jgi:CRISPR-associated protein Csh2